MSDRENEQLRAARAALAVLQQQTSPVYLVLVAIDRDGKEVTGLPADHFDAEQKRLAYKLANTIAVLLAMQKDADLYPAELLEKKAVEKCN